MKLMGSQISSTRPEACASSRIGYRGLPGDRSACSKGNLCSLSYHIFVPDTGAVAALPAPSSAS